MESGETTHQGSDLDADIIIGTQVPSSRSQQYQYLDYDQMLMPLCFEYNGNSSCNDGEATFGLSQDMGISYTEMLLSVEAPSLYQSYLHNNGGGSSMVEPMGSENKTFMITGRYASSQSILLDENGDEEEQPQFGDRDEVEEDEEQADFDNERIQDDDADKFYNWHWNDKWQSNDNGQQNECSEGK